MGIRAIAGVLAAQIIQALGYTPVNKAGDSMTGPLLAADGTAAAPSYAFSNSTNIGLYKAGSSLGFSVAGADVAYAIQGGGLIGVTFLGISGSQDVRLYRDAANTLAQRNGTNAQSYRVYNTYTDASNYERGGLDWNSVANTLVVGTENAGTGTARVLRLNSATGYIAVSSNLAPLSTGTYDNGLPGSAWKRLYIDYTNTGTVGNVTINKAAGRVNLAAAGTTLTVTNSLVTANSHIFLNADSAPGNVVAVQFFAVASAGSFTVNAVPAITNQTAIDFFIVNAD